MNAKETKLQDIIQGDKQFVVPLFQRTYSWDKKQWETLWNDVYELYNQEETTEIEVKSKTHFMGSIVNFPVNSVPEGIAKFLLIDGQQRLTTILIMLIAVRDIAKNSEKDDDKMLAKEIQQKFIINDFKKGNELYKILPTQGDREFFELLVREKSHNPAELSKIIRGYEFFSQKMKKITNLEKLKSIIATKLSLVSITLDSDDDPYLVFESLNSKGEPLSPADLIRNHFFMCIHTDKQEEVYKEYWKPMQDNLGKHLTDFIKHFLMREGGFIKQADIYSTLKKRVNVHNAINKLTEISGFSFYYQRLLEPDYETHTGIRKYLKRLNKIDVTTSFPLLLNFYYAYEQKQITADQFVEILQILENFLIRRAICAVPSNQLNKIFPELYKQIMEKDSNDPIKAMKQILQTKGYPKDVEFKEYLCKKTKFYGASQLNIRTQLILESIEELSEHKEQVNFETNKMTIEHILPQNIENVDIWKQDLGKDWEFVHELYTHSLGNLTLTAYNSELSNAPFQKKKELLRNSHLELNTYFEEIKVWNQEEIEKRSEYLADKCLLIWNYFGISNEPKTADNQEVKNTVPTGLWILSQYFQVQSWRDVLLETLNTIAELEPEKFEIIAKDYPSSIFLKTERNPRDVRKLKNGYLVNVNLDANRIQRFCHQTIASIGLTSEDWKVAFTSYAGQE